MAAGTVLGATLHLIIFSVKIVVIKGALVDAHLAFDAALRVSLN
jgi:hypothetical protein